MNTGATADMPIRSFDTQTAFAKWLAAEHSVRNGLWIQFFKKHSGIPSITYNQALDEALCYGWIDGQLKKYDEQSWIHRFTPRRPRSIWSKKNVEHVERLIKAGKMKPAG